MMEAVRNYLLSVVAVGFLVTLANAIVPKGILKNLVTFTGGLIVVLAVIAPVVHLDFEAIEDVLDDFSVQDSSLSQTANFKSQDVLKQLIIEKTQSYILDKAQSLGMEITVDIELAWEDSVPYPNATTIRGNYTQAQKTLLSQYLESSLAIPKERQAWYTCDELEIQ